MILQANQKDHKTRSKLCDKKKRQGTRKVALVAPPPICIYRCHTYLCISPPKSLHCFFLPNVRKLQPTRGKEARQAAGIVGRGGAIVHPEVSTASDPPPPQTKREKIIGQRGKEGKGRKKSWDAKKKNAIETTLGVSVIFVKQRGTVVFVRRCLFLGTC